MTVAFSFMSHSEIHNTFVSLFADIAKTKAVTLDDVLRIESELATTFPNSYLTFITTYGAVFTPSIFELIAPDESGDRPEGASWDIMEFFNGPGVIEAAHGYWSAGMGNTFVPIAMDSMGNVFGFGRKVCDSRPDDSAVLFFDHEFCKVSEESESFDLWLNSFITVHKQVFNLGGEQRRS